MLRDILEVSFHMSLCPLEQRYNISSTEFVTLMDQNPSLRGMCLGYIAEHQLQKLHLKGEHFTDVCKDDDHDRKKKGDRRFIYRERSFTVESKSLQTKTCTKIGDTWYGSAQVDASDRRTVTFEDGSSIDTTLLLRGEFDVLAVNCFAFGNEFRYLFARNEDLPFSDYKKYTPLQQRALIRSTVSVSWPPPPMFSTSLTEVLDKIISDQEGGQ